MLAARELAKKRYILDNGQVVNTRQEAENYYASLYQSQLTATREIAEAVRQADSNAEESAESTDARRSRGSSEETALLAFVESNVSEAEIGDDDEAFTLNSLSRFLIAKKFTNLSSGDVLMPEISAPRSGR